MDQKINVRLEKIFRFKKIFRTSNSFVALRTVFFFRFDNNFAISKIVLDLTEICRFHKNYEAGFDIISWI